MSNVVGDFIPGYVVVPLAHNSFGHRIMQRRESVVRQLANIVIDAVDLKRIVHSRLGLFICLIDVFTIIFLYYFSYQFINMSTTRKAPPKSATLFESGNAIQLMIPAQVKVFFPT